MRYDLNKIVNELTDEQLIQCMASFGVDNYIERPDYFIFPTICHNEYVDEASMKLYYYKKNKRFHCYTECGDTFNIFELIKRVFETREKREVSFRESLDYFIKIVGSDATAAEPVVNKYVSIKDRYAKKNRVVELKTYSKDLINLFVKLYPQEWIDEGIGEPAMDKFNIRYSISQNKIIIPHYDINGNLIGIRGRTLNPLEIELYGKYMPVKIENTLYSHPLSQNLYGLNITKENIITSKKVILYESEKSVLMHETYFDVNNSVAVCGSNFNKVQLEILLKETNPEEIIVAFDKEYDSAASQEGQKYFNKLWEICKRYSNYCTMSFIYDRENLLNKKDSPIDKGKDIFLSLYKKRIMV